MISQKDDKRSIIVNLDSAHKVKVEPHREFETSIFRGVYENAAFMLSDIINAAEREAEARRENVVTNSEPICNIISYLGERGEGKTSAMLSFCNFLAQIHTMETGRINVPFKKVPVLNTLPGMAAKQPQTIHEHLQGRKNRFSDSSRRNLEFLGWGTFAP